MLCDSFTHICTLWINRSNLILFYVLLENIIHYDQFCQFEHAWVSMFDKHHPFWYLLCNAHLKKNMFLCLCQPSLWPICQCTCLGLWPMGITLFPYVLWMPIFVGLIPCPSGIVESRYAPNTGYAYGLCGKGDVFTNRMGESACVAAQAFQASFCCM